MLERRFLAPHALAAWAGRTPGAVALEHIDGERLTYEELYADSLRWADAFRRVGVDPHRRLSPPCSPNCTTAHRTMLGLAWLRAIEIPLNTAYTGRMLQYALDHADATSLVVASEFLERVLAVGAALPSLGTVIVADGPAPDVETPFRLIGADEFLDGAEASDDAGGPDVWDVAALLYTSGTTGPSKAVISPWGFIYQMWSWVPRGRHARAGATQCATSLPAVVPQLRLYDLGFNTAAHAGRPFRVPGQVQRHPRLERRAA